MLYIADSAHQAIGINNLLMSKLQHTSTHHASHAFPNPMHMLKGCKLPGSRYNTGLGFSTAFHTITSRLIHKCSSTLPCPVLLWYVPQLLCRCPGMRPMLQRQLSSWDQELQLTGAAAPVGLILRHLMLLKHMTRLYEGKMIITVATWKNLKVGFLFTCMDHHSCALSICGTSATASCACTS